MLCGAVDKVDRQNLNRSVAALAVMAYKLAEQEATLPPVEPAADDD